ncbi:mCG140243 [Mus musculus]|nr:mCG140243 [Mus musculus]
MVLQFSKAMLTFMDQVFKQEEASLMMAEQCAE